MYRSAKKYVDDGYRDRWDSYFAIYSGQRVDPSYFGTIKVNNREAHTIIETLVSNIAGGLPEWDYIPTNEEQRTDTALLNSIADFYMEDNAMEIKTQIWVRDCLMYGTGIVHVPWRNGKPVIENIPLRDFFVDPTSTGIERTQKPARYAGYEYLASKEELKNTKIFSAKEGKMVSKYKNIDEFGEAPVSAGGEQQETDKQFKDMFNGSTLDTASSDQMHVIKLYDLQTGKVVEIGNKQGYIFEGKIPFQREEKTKTVTVLLDGEYIDSKKKLTKIAPYLPFADIRDYIDSSVFHGEGEMAVLMGDSELLNDYEEMDADNTSYQNTPTSGIDPQFADMAGDIELIAGAVYPIPKGALYTLDLPQLGEGIRLKKQDILARMRSGTAADEAVQGIGQTKSRTTAYEVQTQLQQAQGRFTTKLTNLSSGGFKQLGSVLFKHMQIFLTPDSAVRITGKEGISFGFFDAWDWDGEYSPQVQLQAQIAQKRQISEQKDVALFQTLDASAAVLDPIEYMRFKIKRIDPSLSDKQINQMIAKPDPNAGKDAREFVQLDKIYVDPNTPPDIKMQIEEMIGLTPSPMHEVDTQNKLIGHAADNANRLDQGVDANGIPIPPEQPVTQ